MKKTIFIISILSIWLYANPNQEQNPLSSKEELIKEYREMFEKISKKRVGLDEDEIEKVQQPFLTIKKKSKKTSTKNIANQNTITLNAIFNKKAMINGKWYSLYQKINGKKIIKITDSTVWLKDTTGIEKLTIRIKNANISIK